MARRVDETWVPWGSSNMTVGPRKAAATLAMARAKTMADPPAARPRSRRSPAAESCLELGGLHVAPNALQCLHAMHVRVGHTLPRRRVGGTRETGTEVAAGVDLGTCGMDSGRHHVLHLRIHGEDEVPVDHGRGRPPLQDVSNGLGLHLEVVETRPEA